MSEFGQKAIAVGTLVAVAAASFEAYEHREGLETALKCVEHPMHCLFDSHSEAKPAAPEFGDFHKVSERLVATFAIQTFGEAQISVSGIGHVDYTSGNWLERTSPIGGVDGTYFLEPKPVTLDYEPCIKTADDYTKEGLSTDGNGETAHTGLLTLTTQEFTDPVTHQEHSEVKVDMGAIGACDMRIHVGNDPAGDQNAQRFRISGKVQNGILRTFEQEADTELVDYADQAACPAGIVNLRAVENDVAILARGLMASSTDVRWHEHVEDTLLFNIASSRVGQLSAAAKLKADQASFSTRKRSLPDSKGHTQPMRPTNFENFQLDGCTPGQLAIVQEPSLKTPITVPVPTTAHNIARLNARINQVQWAPTLEAT